MIINDKEAAARLSSPMNLINRLRSDKKNNAMSLFGIGKKEILPIIEKTSNPFQKSETQLSVSVPSSSPQVLASTNLDNILENHESQIKLGLAHDSALNLLTNSLKQLSEKLDDVRADKLPAVISAASKTVESIRKERMESAKQGKDREVHYHFYTPEQKKISDYQIIDVA